jgi:hypothetical protein
MRIGSAFCRPISPAWCFPWMAGIICDGGRTTNLFPRAMFGDDITEGRY